MDLALNLMRKINAYFKLSKSRKFDMLSLIRLQLNYEEEKVQASQD